MHGCDIMKEILLQYALYNVWAHQKIFDTIRGLSEEQIHRQIAGSFPGIFKTGLHLMDAESMWWQRLKLSERVERPSELFIGNISDLEKQLLQQSRIWAEWVRNANEQQLLHVFAYQNTKKEQFKQAVNEVLLHIFNHSTYHRGQIIVMFHQLSVEKIPNTDFISYARNKK